MQLDFVNQMSDELINKRLNFRLTSLDKPFDDILKEYRELLSVGFVASALQQVF